MISYCNSHQKKVASMLLFIFLLNLTSPLISYAKPLPSGSGPVANELAKYVDPFTGDFSYSVPLLNISGPNGESFPISANYSAGISMNQESSWIGLGWDFNPGEINRNVNGFPDDWKGDVSSSVEQNATSLVTKNINGYGPLYFSQFNYTDNDASMDIYQSSRLLKHNHTFEYPDYDDYYVSGFGKMQPYIFEYGTLVQKNQTKEKNGERFSYISYNYDEIRNTSSAHYKSFNRAPEFRFTNEMLGVKAPEPRASLPNNANNNLNAPSVLSSSNQSSFKYTLNNTTSNLDNSTLPKGKQIFYFTNNYINNQIGDLQEFSNFLNYFPIVNGDPRPSTSFEGNGIGAFQVVDIDGKTYHYSLPVYTSENVSCSFVFNSPVFDPENHTTGTQGFRDNFNPYRLIDGTKEYTQTVQNKRYASSWKLTAITGPDFEDTNQDGIANDGDKGYWITFDYGKWSGNYNWRSPYYGVYTTSMSNNYAPMSLGRTWGEENFRRNGNYSNEVLRQGSFSQGKSDLYYLNSIETSTQKAVFVKSIRKDAHSLSLTSAAPSNTTVVHKIKLDKIVLFNKTDVNVYDFKNADANSYSSINPSGAQNIIDVNDYYQLENSYHLSEKSLKTIDFIYDYSLCKGNYNNLNQGCNVEALSHAQNANMGYYNFTGYTDGIIKEESGKLTLLEIITKEQNAKQIYPSYVFNYDQNNPVKNPNFNPDQQDFWGYYKSDFHQNYRGHYTTYNSAQHTDAWSLKSIITPTGSEIKLTYESDKYSSIGYDENETSIEPSNTTKVNKNLIQRVFQVYNVREGATNNAKAYLLDNDAYYFMTSSNEDKNTKREMRLPLKLSNGTVVKFICNTTDVDKYDKPDFGFGYNNTTSTKDGNYIWIDQDGSKICNGNVYNNYSTAIYKGAGFIVQYLNSAYGGGIRVKSISIKDVKAPTQYALNYKYNNGVASSEPDYFASMSDYQYFLSLNTVGADRNVPASNVGYSNVEVINSGEYTSIAENNADYIGKTVFEYHNYTKDYSADDKLIEDTPYEDECGVNSNNFDIGDNRDLRRNIRSYIPIKKDLTSTYGKLKSKSVLDKNNNIIDLVKYSYKNLETTSQIFYTKYLYEWTENTTYSRYCNAVGTRQINHNNWDDYIVKVMKKTDMISVLDNVTHYNNGHLVEESNTSLDSYNLITGSPNSVLVSDISKLTKEMVSSPAYLESGNEAMGIKTNHNSSNKNMLAENAKVQVNYKALSTNDAIINNNSSGIINASYTQWKNSATVRKHNSSTNEFQNYSSTSVAYFPYAVKEFNGNSTASNWDLKNEITLLDEHNRTLEIKDIRNRKSSTKYNSFGNGKLADAINAGYTSFMFSSFEESQQFNGNLFFGGELNGHSSSYRIEQTPQVKAHSGSYVCKLPTGIVYGPNYKVKVNSTDGLQAGRKYVAKVWVHNSSESDAKVFIHIKGKIGSTAHEDYKETKLSDAGNLTLGNWTLLKVEMNVPSNFTTTQSDEFFNAGLAKSPDGSDAFYDDFMLSPIDAQVTGYVINPFNKQVEYTINNDGIVSKYEYDPAGRILFTSIETENGMKIISKNKYNFGR